MHQPASPSQPSRAESATLQLGRRFAAFGGPPRTDAGTLDAMRAAGGHRSRWASIRWWLFAVTLIFAVPAASCFVLSQQRATDLLEIAHYNDVFDVSQMQTELLRFNAELGRYAADPSPASADLVRLRYDFLANHTDMLKQTGVIRTLDVAVPGLSPELDGAMGAVAPLVAGLASGPEAARILRITTPLETSLAYATAYVGERSADSVSRAALALRSVRNTLLVLVAGLMAAALGLTAVLRWQHADMRRLAYRDTLTGLPNRLAFNGALEEACTKPSTSVLLADVDHFKDINDSFGHDVGDALLRQMASRLAHAVPEGTLIARLGGDEFAMVLDVGTAAQATAVADRICAAAADPFRIGDLLLRSGLSVGTVVDVERAREPVALLKRADLALYTAKAAGRGRPFLFDPALERGFTARRDMEEDLRADVANDAISVHFQPLVEIGTGRPLGCEALARWEHPRHGRVAPSEFIPLAERSALIVALGHRVLARACAEATTWPGDMRVAVNVSAQQLLETDFADRVSVVLAETGLAPARLELEITESVLLRIHDDVLERIQALRRLGVTFALDDFGTGYSSLSRLHHLPLDKLKIDQSFTRAMETSGEALGVVETIIDLARKLGMTTTAEGVETPRQNAMLMRAGCDQGQGYLYARPMPPEQCRKALVEAPWRLPAAGDGPDLPALPRVA